MERRYKLPGHIAVFLTVMACLCLCIGIVSAGTTGKISGKVTMAAGGQPLPGVNVVIVGTSMGATSDPDGDYFINNVPPGAYKVKASIIGFKAVTVTEVRVRIDAATELNFSMEETVVEVGNEIVVTATRPLVEKDNTSSRTILESSDIANRPTKELSTVLVTLPSINNENGKIGRAHV